MYNAEQHASMSVSKVAEIIRRVRGKFLSLKDTRTADTISVTNQLRHFAIFSSQWRSLCCEDDDHAK